MASIYKEVAVEVSPAQAWAALRRVGDAHRLFTPVLVHAQLDDDVRTVRFANGMVLQERILDVDDERRRVAYTALNGPGMTYHHASMQILDAGPLGCLFVWITDFLPRDMSDNLTPLIEQGAQALKSNLERVDPERYTK